MRHSRAHTHEAARAPSTDAPSSAAVCAVLAALVSSLVFAGCNGGNEADRVGVGASCFADGDCPVVPCDVEPCPELICLTQFTGGYCGLSGCADDADCPFGSACVTHTDLTNYCFRICANKPECNRNRGPDEESNCSSSVDFVVEQSSKACVPPSSGL